jgi:hypothetical protein
MYDQLRARLATLLSKPRSLKPQTQRQLEQHLAEHSSDLSSFLLCASAVLEDYELDIVFGPLFTPTIDERAELADLLFHWRPSIEQLRQLVDDICTDVPHVTVMLPDGNLAKLTTHEVMIDRFVRLLRLDAGPDAATAAALRDALPAELWPIAIALLCERGMSEAHQHFFAAFVNHLSLNRVPISRGLLETAAEFLAGQKSFNHAALLAAAEALMRATEGTAAYASGGHTYWSPDVAQHHHYRGEGKVDQERLEQRQAELQHVTALVEGLRTFEMGNLKSEI